MYEREIYLKELVHAVAGPGRPKFHRVEEGRLETQARMRVAVLRLLESELCLQRRHSGWKSLGTDPVVLSLKSRAGWLCLLQS